MDSVTKYSGGIIEGIKTLIGVEIICEKATICEGLSVWHVTAVYEGGREEADFETENEACAYAEGVKKAVRRELEQLFGRKELHCLCKRVYGELFEE